MATVQIIDEFSQGQRLDHAVPSVATLKDIKPLEAVAIEATPLSDPESQSETSVAVSDDGKSSQELELLNAPTSAKSAPAPASSPSELKARSFVVAAEVLSIVESYGVLQEGENWAAFDNFVPIVAKQVARQERIKILLPAFPFKSPNTKDIVIGTLPDLGEELALAHLNGLADNIAAVYAPGAEVEICSDGLVYNDFQGVSDETAWEYGEALRDIAVRDDLKNLSFVRVWDLLDYPRRSLGDKEKAKAFFLEHALYIRRELDYRYGIKNFDVDHAIATDKDIAFTYESYVDFLNKELPEREDGQGIPADVVAKRMLARGKAYAAILSANRADSIRLSIHNSIGKGKLSVPMIPQAKDTVGLMPWRSAVAIEIDGSYRTVYPGEVRHTHELVYRNGRPYCFRIKSDLFDWKADGLEVDFEHLYPCGVIVRPRAAEAPSMRNIPMQKVRHLSHHFSPIVMRGFAETTGEELYVEKGYELGKMLTWALTGTIFKVKDSGDTTKMANNVTSNEPLPMHFDGIFKFEDREDPVTGEIKKVLNPPGYQYFTCIATAPKGDGYTLFCNSRLFFNNLPAPWTLERLEPVTWDMDNDGFWSNKQTGLALVKRHPSTGAPCLRWHQPWDASKTKYSSYVITIENDEQSLVQVIDKLVYDYRVCLRFAWQVGDLLVNDNVAMLHTRTSYTSNCAREMWRIHLD